LEAAGKSKIAEALADPEIDADAFEEGWQNALESERNGGVAPTNGHDGVDEAAALPQQPEPEKGVVSEIVDKVKELAVGDGTDAKEPRESGCAASFFILG
jgi:hypothetical protein